MLSFASPWLVRQRRSPDASVRLFCFHCAGGSASEYRSWSAHLPSSIELMAVQLPGREGRINEPFITRMVDLAGGVAESLKPYLDKPYVVLGHSLGSLVGFEVIRELRRRGLNQPFLFIPVGRQAPQLKRKKPPIASLPEAEFVEELRKDYGNHIGAVLDSPELREVFIPQIQADFALSENYRFGDEEPLDCPIVAFAGASEKDLEMHELNAWSAHTSRSFRSRLFPGDHFFVRASQRLLIEAIKQEVASVRHERPARSHLQA